MSGLNVAVVFHSVCGNTCELAQCFGSALERQGCTVRLYRLPDPGYAVTADAFAASRQFKETISAIPLLQNTGQLLDCDAVALGSPTYFGNVSAPVKVLMDSFVDYYSNAPFAGKPFAAFATSGTAQGGADFCLQALGIFAQHVGMIPISVPAGDGHPQPAYGLAHYSGDLGDQRLTSDEKQSVQRFAAHFYRMAAALCGRGRSD